jgi:DNA-binding beta-propeller fold protein YncE
VLREGNSVWRLDRRDLRLYHVAGTGEKGFSGDGGNALDATFNGPKGIAVDPGRAVYVADTENHAIRMIDLKSQKIQTIAGSPSGTRGFNGDGDAPDTRLLNRPHGVCLLSNGALLIGDSENHRVRMLEK